MCLSDVYQIQAQGASEQVASKASGLKVAGDTITIYDIFGDEKTLRGTIEEVDLLENKIVIRACE